MPLEIRRLIREISLANPLWGAPRIHGELLKLGIDVGQTSVAKHMARYRTSFPRLEDGPAQSCRWHRIDRSVCRSDDLIPAAIRPVDSTARPTPNAMAGSDGALDNRMDCPATYRGLRLGPVPRFIIRDRDRVYRELFKRWLRAMGIRDRPTALRSPWQNGHAERLIGSIRRECLDHVVVFGERHLHEIPSLICSITTALARIYP